MTFTLTEGQERAVKLAKRLTEAPGGIGLIKGYAGTGKTTTLVEILKELGEVVLLAPTGKAAARIQEITGVGASTLHRWIYKVQTDEKTGEPTFSRKGWEDIQVPVSRLVVMDEASMVGQDMYNDLTEVVSALKCSLLLIGDGFQLPPVSKIDEKPFSVFEGIVPEKNTVVLEEIMRQALDSPIIRASLQIRNGELAEAMSEIDIVLPEDLETQLADDKYGMIVCWKNDTRHRLNNMVREVRKFGTELRAGEPLLVLRNNYAAEVYNGEVHTFSGWIDNLGRKDIRVPTSTGAETVRVDFGTALLGDKEVILAKDVLMGHGDKLSPYHLERGIKFWLKKKMSYIHANLGYALTCHKCQGSQAQSVLVCIEKNSMWRYRQVEGLRSLYTAVTRAQTNVSLAHLPF